MKLVKKYPLAKVPNFNRNSIKDVIFDFVFSLNTTFYLTFKKLIKQNQISTNWYLNQLLQSGLSAFIKERYKEILK